MKDFFALPALLLSITVFVTPQCSAQRYTIPTGHNIITAKNYYLISRMQDDSAVQKLLLTDTVLKNICGIKMVALSSSLTNCKDELSCYIAAERLTESEITTIGERLAALYRTGNAIDRMLRHYIIPSGCYILFHLLPPRELLVKAWEQDARGINFVIDVYAAGKKANYPLIDSISFDTKSKGYTRLLYSLNELLVQCCKNEKLFFVPSLTAVLQLLEFNEREQAADFEPMNKGINKPAFTRIKGIQWNKYKYSLIMIPGAGPDDPRTALSAEGMIRCKLAAIQYHNGVAPLLVTSGGRVHPYKTTYCEAVEMKRYLVEKLHIPADVILVDPHARHTTTNMRNTARLIYRYGIPVNKAALTCTTRGQSTMIESTLPKRCLTELQEIPYKNGVRLSETVMEFYPLPEALQLNPTEPMDP